jgi:hypothetical protein
LSHDDEAKANPFAELLPTLIFWTLASRDLQSKKFHLAFLSDFLMMVLQKSGYWISWFYTQLFVQTGIYIPQSKHF